MTDDNGNHAATPGPWAIEYDGPSLPIITAPAATSARKIMTDVIAHAKGDNAEANARLIAAAPELLEALEVALIYLEHAGDGAVRYPEDDKAEQQARAALAKARA